MNKSSKLMREIKEMLSISSFFFVIFVLFLFMKKVWLDEYSVDFYVLGTALVGSLVIAKVVLIFDLLPITKKTAHLINIYRVILRSLIYAIGYLLFSFVEHVVKGLIHGESFSESLSEALHHLYSPDFIAGFVGIFIAFLFFNAFWVIRAKVGPAALYDMFFRKDDSKRDVT